MADSQNPSVALFGRFLNERFDEFKSRLAELMRLLATNDQADKVRSAKAAYEAATNLRQALSKGDQPSWLAPFEQALHTYAHNNANATVGHQLITTIGNLYADVGRHTWNLDSMDNSSFDFDGLYREYESQSRIPELFDKLVELLEQVLASGAVDSVKIVRQLENIIAMLKKNRKGSYFSVVVTWRFVGRYLKNVLWGIVKEIPGLRVPVLAMRETLREIDDEMAKMHDGMNTAIGQNLEADMPLVEYQPVPAPEPLALTDEASVIDAEFEVKKRDNPAFASPDCKPSMSAK